MLIKFKKMYKLKTNKKGFTLIELIVFVTILSTILVTMAGFTVSIHRRLKINSHKVIANFHAENLKEWLNGERISDWPAVQAKASLSPSAPIVYCLNNAIPLSHSISTLISGSCATYSGVVGTVPIMYKRELSLVRDTSGTVISRITVSWLEDGVPYSVTNSSVYSFWQ